MVITKAKLLKIPEVVNEINRHLWFESERAGYDVGRQYAESDWIKKYSKDWIKHNLPNEAKKKPAPVRAKKRRAKSYTG